MTFDGGRFGGHVWLGFMSNDFGGWFPIEIHCQLGTRYSGSLRNLVSRFIWLWLKIQQEGIRRFWSMFPLARVPFWVPVFWATAISTVVHFGPCLRKSRHPFSVASERAETRSGRKFGGGNPTETAQLLYPRVLDQLRGSEQLMESLPLDEKRDGAKLHHLYV